MPTFLKHHPRDFCKRSLLNHASLMQIFIFVRNVVLKKYDRRYLQSDVNGRIMHTPLPNLHYLFILVTIINELNANTSL